MTCANDKVGAEGNGAEHISCGSAAAEGFRAKMERLIAEGDYNNLF
jgi:hypothetical protein